MGLTKRESEVMFWIVQGLSNTQIANQLVCSDKTIKKHLEHIYSKLKVQSRSRAVAIALDFWFYFYTSDFSLTRSKVISSIN